MEDKYQTPVSLVRRNIPIEWFQTYILDSRANKSALAEAIRNSQTENINRFNTWRMLLDVMNVDSEWEQKLEQIQASRKRYGDLKEESRTGVKNNSANKEAAPVNKNPLMKTVVKQEKKEPEADSFLREEIKKDVDRTYQDLPLFQDPSILKLLSSILFVWCKLNPEISYKQGMNELLASVVHVYFEEAVLPGEAEKHNHDGLNKYQSISATNYAEADIYCVFEKIMNIQKEMYKTETDVEKKCLVNPNSKNNTPILQRIIQVQDHRLRAMDLELFRILKLHDVKTKTFLLRWIRCMHTREFTLENSFIIWDSIFLQSFESNVSRNKVQFEFIDAMCIAMFIYMRSIVLTREAPNQITQIYQKYPSLKKGEYLEELITLAWSVISELRTPALQTVNVEDNADRLKKVGLMERGGYVDIFKDSNKKSDNPKKEITTPKVKDRLMPKEEEIPIKKSEDVAQREQFGLESLDSKVTVTEAQIREWVSILDQSNNLNDNFDSRAMVNKVLKSLQSKLETE